MIQDIKQHYFGESWCLDESPILNLSLAIPAVILAVGILLSAVVSIVWAVGAAVAVFMVLMAIHFVLWVAGGLYRNGVVGSLRKTGFVLGGLVLFVVTLATVVFGWVFIAPIFLGVIKAYAPPILQPLFGIVVMAGCVYWSYRGFEWIGW